MPLKDDIMKVIHQYYAKENRDFSVERIAHHLKENGTLENRYDTISLDELVFQIHHLCRRLVKENVLSYEGYPAREDPTDANQHFKLRRQ